MTTEPRKIQQEVAMKDPTNKTELLAAMREARRLWDSWIAKVSPERMSEPVAPGEWSVKDILAHTTEYDRWLGLGLALRLQKPPDLWLADLSLDQFNAALHAQMHDRPPAEVLADSQRVFAEMVQAVVAHSEAYLFGSHHVAGVPYEVQPFELLKSESYGHYYDHLPTIKEWVAGITR
jgi:hypothetical protein